MHPSGKVIRLGKNHRYFIKGENINFTSCTTLLKKFFPEFNREEVAKKYAEKHGLNWKDVADGWKKLGRDSSNRGKKYHKFSEDVYRRYVTGKYKDIISGFGTDIIENRMEKILLNLFQMYTFLPPETIVGSISFKIAGSLDLLGYSDISKSLFIGDWKFVNEIKVDNIWEKAYFPIERLDNCNYNKYCLQLNLYSFLIKKEKYFPDHTNHVLRLFHVTENDVIVIKVPNMQTDIRNILIEWERIKGS